jgi:hypothetical protein
MEVDVPRDALVIRFSPTMPETVLKRADQAYRECGRYQLSVFAAVKQGDESEEDLHARLLQASEMHHISPETNRKYFVCSEAGRLYDRGFTFWKDGDPDETPEHYSVDLGVDAIQDQVLSFLDAFDPIGVRRP